MIAVLTLYLVAQHFSFLNDTLTRNLTLSPSTNCSGCVSFNGCHLQLLSQMFQRIIKLIRDGLNASLPLTCLSFLVLSFCPGLFHSFVFFFFFLMLLINHNSKAMPVFLSFKLFQSPLSWDNIEEKEWKGLLAC